MSYTQPYGQPQGLASRFTNKLREILIAEVYAINGYQSHIAGSNIEEINKVWHSIMMDEKKHYGWILRLIRKYDPEQAKQYELFKNANQEKSPLQNHGGTTPQIILNSIREDIKGEMEAVILYEDELLKFPYDDIRKALRLIIDEEKGHAEHLTRLLLKYDPDMYDALE